MEEDELNARAAGAFGALLSQTILEVLVVAGRITLEDAVNVCVSVRDTAKQAGDPVHDRAAEAARLLETQFRKRLAEASGRRSK